MPKLNDYFLWGETLVLVILLGFFSGIAKGQYRENIQQKPGLVRLNTDIVAEDYQWFVFYPPQTDFVKTNNGQTCVFAACKTGVTYSVALTAINYTEKSSIQKIFFVEIAGDAPNPPLPPDPPDPPEPEPNPEPDFEPGRYGLARYCYDLAPKSGQNPLIAQALANNFQAVSSSIAAGVIKDINSANKDLKARNQATFNNFGGTPPEWEQFFQKFAEKMNNFFQGGQLTTVQDFRVALTEIENGLRAVK